MPLNHPEQPVSTTQTFISYILSAESLCRTEKMILKKQYYCILNISQHITLPLKKVHRSITVRKRDCWSFLPRKSRQICCLLRLKYYALLDMNITRSQTMHSPASSHGTIRYTGRVEIMLVSGFQLIHFTKKDR